MVTCTLLETTLLENGRVVCPDGVRDDVWVLVRGARVDAVGSTRHPASDHRIDLAGRWLVPGFVDLHMHGGGGHDATASPVGMAQAAAFHRTHGTTGTLVSLMAAPVEALEQQLRWVAELTSHAGSTVIGAHLEGPFLSRARCGAQDPENLLAPDLEVFRRLVAAAAGTLRTITVAPELPGALELIRAARALGVVVCIGHTDADFDRTTEAIEAGASAATHLFNAMPPLTHRAPGAAGAALAAGIACELINDGVHTHPSLCRVVADSPGRLVLVTDAIAASGQPDGEYRLGGRPVVVRGGAARLPGTQTLAGSTLTLDDALRRAVHESGLTLEAAVTAASTTPARLLGMTERGTIVAGKRADLVVLDDALAVRAVLHGGEWIDQGF